MDPSFTPLNVVMSYSLYEIFNIVDRRPDTSYPLNLPVLFPTATPVSKLDFDRCSRKNLETQEARGKTRSLGTESIGFYCFQPLSAAILNSIGTISGATRRIKLRELIKCQPVRLGDTQDWM